MAPSNICDLFNRSNKKYNFENSDSELRCFTAVIMERYLKVPDQSSYNVDQKFLNSLSATSPEIFYPFKPLTPVPAITGRDELWPFFHS